LFCCSATLLLPVVVRGAVVHRAKGHIVRKEGLDMKAREAAAPVTGNGKSEAWTRLLHSGRR
jgi:hypothetical protein